jgi:hypothetical protein
LLAASEKLLRTGRIRIDYLGHAHPAGDDMTVRMPLPDLKEAK